MFEKIILNSCHKRLFFFFLDYLACYSFYLVIISDDTFKVIYFVVCIRICSYGKCMLGLL